MHVHFHVSIDDPSIPSQIPIYLPGIENLVIKRLEFSLVGNSFLNFQSITFGNSLVVLCAADYECGSIVI